MCAGAAYFNLLINPKNDLCILCKRHISHSWNAELDKDNFATLRDKYFGTMKVLHFQSRSPSLSKYIMIELPQSWMVQV